MTGRIAGDPSVTRSMRAAPAGMSIGALPGTHPGPGRVLGRLARGRLTHLRLHDTTLVFVSRGRIDRIEATTTRRSRMANVIGGRAWWVFTVVELRVSRSALRAVHLRHPDVHEHDVGSGAPDGRDRFGSVGRLRRHLDAVLGHYADPVRYRHQRPTPP